MKRDLGLLKRIFANYLKAGCSYLIVLFCRKVRIQSYHYFCNNSRLSWKYETETRLLQRMWLLKVLLFSRNKSVYDDRLKFCSLSKYVAVSPNIRIFCCCDFPRSQRRNKSYYPFLTPPKKRLMLRDMNLPANPRYNCNWIFSCGRRNAGLNSVSYFSC